MLESTCLSLKWTHYTHLLQVRSISGRTVYNKQKKKGKMASPFLGFVHKADLMWILHRNE